MGYFNNEDIFRKDYDREEINPYANKEEWIQKIKEVFPQEKYADLHKLDEETIKGLYAQACKKLKLEAMREANSQNMVDASTIFDSEEERRLGR